MNIKEVKKKNGTIVYRANVYLGTDRLTGKKARKSITASTKKAVKTKAREAVNEFINNGYTTKAKATVKTYKELASIWWDSYKNTVKPNTQQSTKGLLKVHILPVFGDYKLDKLTTPIIQQQVNKWADKANKGVKGAYANYNLLHNVNSRILKYGVAMQLIQHNPATDVIVPRKKQKEQSKIKFLDRQELKQFLGYLDTLDQSIYENLFDFVLYTFLLATGVRISEALALEWSDIDLDNGYIDVNKTVAFSRMETNSTKSEAGNRKISIDKNTVLMLRLYKARQYQCFMEHGYSSKMAKYVFSNGFNIYPNRTNLQLVLTKHLKQAGLPRFTFHAFRHTHASLLLNAGISYKELQHRLGHSTLAMTMDIYSHLSKEKERDAVNFFEKAMANL